MEEQNTDCRAIVMEYLLHYCYKNSAKALLKEMSNLDNCANALQENSTSNITSNIKGNYDTIANVGMNIVLTYLYIGLDTKPTCKMYINDCLHD
jgi:hypothetical protein